MAQKFDHKAYKKIEIVIKINLKLIKIFIRWFFLKKYGNIIIEINNWLNVIINVLFKYL